MFYKVKTLVLKCKESCDLLLGYFSYVFVHVANLKLTLFDAISMKFVTSCLIASNSPPNYQY